jgi:o-succinylbenzoate---CoA ligase
MAEPLVILQGCRNDWIKGVDHQALIALAQEKYEAIAQHPKRFPTILIAEPDPIHFLASFIAAITAYCPVFLANPTWTEPEWQQVFQQITPDVYWTTPRSRVSLRNPTSSPAHDLSPGWIMIPTGGSSGTVRFAIHTWETLVSSVIGFQEYFQIEQINSCCVLPLYHVSGLMQLLRSLITRGNLVISPYKHLNFPSTHSPDFFLSLVPTQLHRLLQTPFSTEWLSQFKTVLLGGAPAWNELLSSARKHQIRLAPTYGMTETASQIATLKPDDFLQGKTGCGQVLPHAQIEIREEEAIAIQSQSLALGYYPNLFPSRLFQTDDLGYFEGDYLHIIGRRSQKIITGGENVFPSEVEAVIRSSGLVADVYVLGIADSDWGEIVTAVYVPVNEQVTVLMIEDFIRQELSRYKHPKQWIKVNQLPRNAQGKINEAIVREKLCQSPHQVLEIGFLGETRFLGDGRW